MNDILKLEHIKRFYKNGKNQVSILDDINLKIKQGELVALVGPSGSGKSTLLHISGLLDTPSSGSIFLDGTNVKNVSDKIRTNLRKNYIGFIYQSHLLLSDFNALENVVLPQLISGKNKKEAYSYAEYLLEKVGLSHRFSHRPGQLSGGEQQRVAIARALSNKPKFLLADEPTGNLDPSTANTVFHLLLSLVKETGLSALIATHNSELASEMNTKITILDGKIKEIF